MITLRVGDLLQQPDLTHIAHQANLYHTFGAGLAAEIGRLWPHAAEADCRTPYGAEAKLGTYSLADGAPAVVNLYSQSAWRPGPLTDYVALETALRALERSLRDRAGVRVGLPHRLGCGIAGGDWARVREVIDAVFEASPVEVVICARPEDLR